MSAVRRSVVLVICSVLGGCAGPNQHGEAEQHFVKQQRAAAVMARQQGDLARALNLWRSIAPLPQAGPGVPQTIAQLQDEIASRAATAKQSAEAAYQRGATRDGDRWLRQALALQPEDEQALERLAQSHSERVRAQQTGSQNNSQALLEPPAPATTQTTVPQRRHASSDSHSASAVQQHMAAANHARAEGDPERELDELLGATETGMVRNPALQRRVQTLRRDISQRWYQQGNGLMQTDLPAAIKALEKSLAYDPENRVAQIKLKQARTLLHNLEKIQTGG